MGKHERPVSLPQVTEATLVSVRRRGQALLPTEAWEKLYALGQDELADEILAQAAWLDENGLTARETGIAVGALVFYLLHAEAQRNGFLPNVNTALELEDVRLLEDPMSTSYAGRHAGEAAQLPSE